MVEFHALGFSQCIGVLDGTHILTTCPFHGDPHYESQRDFHSVVFQDVVDYYSAFTNMNADWARVVPSRDRDCPGPGSGARQRRAVRKAFRKLAAIQRRQQQQQQQPEPEPEPAAPERMETLVHLVLSQDQTLRQQGQRLRELDRHIEGYEARTHLARVRRHGANYVQDTYLAGPADQGQERQEEEEEWGQEEEAAALVLALAERGEALRRLQERREQLEARLELLGAELQRELNERWMRRRCWELEAAGCSLPEPERCTTELSGCWADGEGEEAAWERDRLKTQLSASLYIGLRLGADLEAVRGALEAAREAGEARRRELRHLRDALAALDVADGREEPEPEPLPEPELWVPKACEDKDEDSDTGLSSMHSQDSDCLPACESLV
ncbi:PREDICTED: ras association domain-containing protein 10 [Crocodylus porosus]|uniref:ras association domain-containing protein 10 n=1 Tax=Crocodylus porosus TaxID=8502 RepID=UPI000938EF13|nr:PREDICTED: ras association domain-containing protein 10 [Crocodylus porosus]